MVIVGNVDVGGSGKTPLVAGLVRLLASQGLRSGIISRGFRAATTAEVAEVFADSDPEQFGDEPVMHAEYACVAIAKRRILAAKLLSSRCDIIIADDGLQHYGLQREIEICVLDEVAGIGNGWCLPAGPLREPPSRLAEVDFVVYKTTGSGAAQASLPPSAYRMYLKPDCAHSLVDTSRRTRLAEWEGQSVHAIAGIGRPASFFTLLRRAGLKVIEHEFDDHHRFSAAELEFDDDRPVLMTTKDGIKCRTLAIKRNNIWVVPITPSFDPDFERGLLDRVAEVIQSQRVGMSSQARSDRVADG